MNNKQTVAKILLFSLIMSAALIGQIYIPADPFNLLITEQEMFAKTDSRFGSLSLRPTFTNSLVNPKAISVKYRSEIFYNTNAPNLENMSDRWVGKGAGLFGSINISFKNKFIMGSVEPYYFIDQNAEYDEPVRRDWFANLNDNRSHHNKSPYQATGIREFQFYLHRNGIGGGISNANMWWGPGIHSSLIMTNNTSGFNHIMLGTLEEKRFKDFGFIGRYIFSKFDDRSKYEPYFTSIVFGLTYYSDPVVSVGFTKSALIGGTYRIADDISWKQAALAFLGQIFPGDVTTYKSRWSRDDNTASGFVSTYFPKSKLIVFIEIGRDDIVWDKYNLILAPDHSVATNFGIRKYGLFYNENLFFGMEYTKILLGHYIPRMSTGPWYTRKDFENHSFNGRNFAAHSGPDSDDFTIYFGWNNNNYSIIPSFNYERHGLQKPAIQIENVGLQKTLLNPWAETKLEFRLDLRYVYKKYNINIFLEEEIVKNLEFRDKKRTGTVLWMGVERIVNTKEIVEALSKIFK